MNKIFFGLYFTLFLPFGNTLNAAMYDDNGNRVFGRQNHMRHGSYNPKIVPKQFKKKRVSLQKVKVRSTNKKRRYLRCDLTQNKKQTYSLYRLKFQQGAPRRCREDIKFILNLPYKTKTKKLLRPYEWTGKKKWRGGN